MPAVAGHASLLAEGDGHAENWPRLTKAADLCVDFAGPEGPPPLNTTLGSSIESFDGSGI